MIVVSEREVEEERKRGREKKSREGSPGQVLFGVSQKGKREGRVNGCDSTARIGRPGIRATFTSGPSTINGIYQAW